MKPRYSIGQKVKIKLAEGQCTPLRDCAIDEYVGQIGEVTNYYSVSPHGSEVFYIYMVKIGPDIKEIALHEDEIEKYISSNSLKARNHC